MKKNFKTVGCTSMPFRLNFDSAAMTSGIILYFFDRKVSKGWFADLKRNVTILGSQNDDAYEERFVIVSFEVLLMIKNTFRSTNSELLGLKFSYKKCYNFSSSIWLRFGFKLYIYRDALFVEDRKHFQKQKH